MAVSLNKLRLLSERRHRPIEWMETKSKYIICHPLRQNIPLAIHMVSLVYNHLKTGHKLKQNRACVDIWIFFYVDIIYYNLILCGANSEQFFSCLPWECVSGMELKWVQVSTWHWLCTSGKVHPAHIFFSTYNTSETCCRVLVFLRLFTFSSCSSTYTCFSTWQSLVEK